MKRKNTGFTLVEIMTVMGIVATLVSLAVVGAVNFKKQANESNCQANLKGIAAGFEVYAARNSLMYAPSEQSSLQFLLDDGCLNQDLTTMPQLANFRYIVASANPSGYDIRAIAVNPALSGHNYQIVTGGLLRRSDTPQPSDADFKYF